MIGEKGMQVRKSSRSRNHAAEAKELLTQSTNEELGFNASERKLKKRKTNVTKNEVEHSDRIDPVEKLLSLNNPNTEILMNFDEEVGFDSQREIPTGAQSDGHLISLNFTKVLNDNLRSYYSNFRRSPIEVYNDNSSFSVLNHRLPVDQEKLEDRGKQYKTKDQCLQTPEVPFFKNVNFNPKQLSYTLDQYFSYDELTSDNEEAGKESSESPDPKTPTSLTSNDFAPKMSFHYRHNNNLNLSLNKAANEQPLDVFKILNQRSVLSGRASEMISTGNFLINDFFL
ncbi:uncharacterized protein PRCAT00003574001 [Priceomyces carsonii]|uniref:uncharacterized protein n=1 Tax=Priceomyces carsonii TaxID=28549 RepID=UPI002ED7FBCC|nr:unnamed protein product [Priceomyces carsonii]